MNIFLKMNTYLTSDAGQKVIGSSLSGLSSALQMFGTLHGASKYDNSANNLYNMLLQYTTNIGGISTNMRQETNVEDVISDARSQNGTTIMSGATSGLAAGAALGSIGGPVGAGIGAVVGGIGGAIFGNSANAARERAARKAAETANQKTGIYNDIASNDSRSLLAQINLRMKYGDNEALNLYLTSRGKDSGSTKFSSLYSNKVYTPFGKIPGVANARVAGGESVLQNTDDPQNAVGTVVKDGKYGLDGPLANLGSKTTVLGRDKDWRDGVSFMKKGRPLTEKLEWINKVEQKESKNDTYLARHTKNVQNSELAKLKTDVSSKLNDLVEQLKYQHILENYQPAIGATRGKDNLPGFRDGYISGISNLGAAAFNTLVGANQYFSAKGDSLYKPEIYAANPYGRLALNTLAGLNMSLYPIIQQLGNVYTNANYATQHSGGLSGALKYVSRIANANNMYNTIATTLPSIQEANNKYKTAFANAAMEIGNQDATRRQQANQFAEESFARAHVARRKAMETGLYNISNALQLFASNEFKRQLGNYMLDIWRDRNKADLDKINSFWKNPQDLKLTNPFQ